MVAITVILAAAIGSSVFGQGTAKSAPQANIDIKAVNLDDHGTIKFEHLGGDPIHFENDNSTTKVMVSLNGGNSVDLNATSLGTFDVGAMKELIFNGNTTINATSGASVNVKIIDVQTKQLICDRTVRF
jgi:FlaG/FlaF family flagellin (archaellin)